MSNVDQYSMTDPEVTRCPFDYYAAMRSESPVHLDKTGFYWVTKYDDVVSSALDAVTYSSQSPITLKKTFHPDVQAVWDKAGLKPLDTLVTSDAPEHDDYRKLGVGLFTPAIVNGMTPKIESLVNELIDRFADKGDVEFLSTFSAVLPGTVVADEFGLPREDQPMFKSWTDALILIQTPGNSTEREVELVKKIVELLKYLGNHIQKAAEGGVSGRVIQTLATMPKKDGSDFTMLERGWMALATFIGGNETTMNVLTMGVHKLALNPSLQQELRDNPDKIDAFVEEMLRLESPVQALPRVATRDIEIQGVVIPKGANVILCTASANRDEECWQSPDEFHLDRADKVRHLAFGKGRHLCVGMHLARKELYIAFRVLLQRLNNIRLAVPEDEIEQAPLPFHRSIVSLPILFDVMDNK